MAVDITDHGATPNDGSDDSEAIRKAAAAAGANGTVYVPSGTYIISSQGIYGAQPLKFGQSEPKGISFVGDGPGVSIIKWEDGYTGSDGSPRGPIWKSGYDHGSVTIEGLTFDGNWRNVDLPDSGKGSTAWGFEFNGGGSTNFRCKNVEWTGWWTNGGICFMGDVQFRYCSFSENGMGADSTSTPNDGHGFNASADSGEILVEDCLFEKGSGVAIDHTDYASGAVRMRRCYVTEMGAAVFKQNHGCGPVYMEHVNAENITGSWIDGNLNDSPLGWGIYYIPGQPDADTIHLNNVRFHGGGGAAVQPDSRHDYSGDLIVADDMNKNGNDSGVWEISDGSNHDINRLSIVNTTSSADRLFDIQSGSGTIKELNRNNNAVPLGSTDSVTIEVDNTGTPAHSVTVPSRTEVGAYAGTSSDGSDGGSDSTSDDSDSTTSPTYGGYNQPSEGTLDWHVPINENFAMIEEDVKSLAQRISDLENK